MKSLADLSAADIRPLLAKALMEGRPCISPPGGEPWHAELVAFDSGFRFRVERDRVWRDDTPVAWVDVTLRSDDYDLERSPADDGDGDVWVDAHGVVIADLEAHDEEVGALAWECHVEEGVNGWVDRITDQIAERLDREAA